MTCGLIRITNPPQPAGFGREDNGGLSGSLETGQRTSESPQFRPPEILRAAGSLSTAAAARVASVMHQRQRVACVEPEDSFRLVVYEMTRKPLGAAFVLGRGGRLEGLITELDLCQALHAGLEPPYTKASEIMTRNFVTVSPATNLRDALQIFRDCVGPPYILPVGDAQSKELLGLIRLFDICQAAAADQEER